MRMLNTFLCLAAALTLSAQEVQPRLGFLVPDRVIDKSVRGKKMFSELETIKKSLGEKIEAKNAEIQKISGQLQSPSIGEAGKETLQKQLRDLDFESKKLQDDSQLEFQRAQQRIIGQFQTEISPLVEQLAKEQKLQVVLTYQPGMVAYADQAWFVAFSDEIAKRYDAKYGSAAPVAAAPKAPAAKAPAKAPAKTPAKPGAKPAVVPAS